MGDESGEGSPPSEHADKRSKETKEEWFKRLNPHRTGSHIER